MENYIKELLQRERKIGIAFGFIVGFLFGLAIPILMML